MPLTPAERRVAARILFEQANLSPDPVDAIGDFFDLTKVQQGDFIQPFVQARRDAVQAAIDAHTAAAAAQLAALQAERDLLDGLLAKI